MRGVAMATATANANSTAALHNPQPDRLSVLRIAQSLNQRDECEAEHHAAHRSLAAHRASSQERPDEIVRAAWRRADFPEGHVATCNKVAL